jgi:outer membrane lipoprotein-sorting protein
MKNNAHKKILMCLKALYLMGLLSFLSVSGGAFSQTFDIDQLMKILAQNPSGRATFTETKHIAMLDKPVQSSGELHYQAPQRLEKRTLKPKPEAMLLDGQTLVVERGRQRHTLELNNYPEVAALIDSIRGTLAGDKAALARSYKLMLEGTQAAWFLDLQPLNKKMLATFTGIKIKGHEEQIKTIEIIQADGDKSIMTIDKISAEK